MTNVTDRQTDRRKHRSPLAIARAVPLKVCEVCNCTRPATDIDREATEKQHNMAFYCNSHRHTNQSIKRCLKPELKHISQFQTVSDYLLYIGDFCNAPAWLNGSL